MNNDYSMRHLGAGLIAATGAIHLILAPEYLGEQAYIGVLFILGGMTALLIAASLWRRDDAAAMHRGVGGEQILHLDIASPPQAHRGENATGDPAANDGAREP